jgi:integrase
MRLSLPFAAWPADDRRLWKMRTTPSAGLFGPDRLARRLRPATLRKARLDYCDWLGFLARQGLLDPDATPDARATPAQLDAFIEDQRARGNSNAAIRTRLAGLRMALRLIAPEADTRFIVRPHGVPLRRWLPDQPRARPFLHLRDIADRAHQHFQAGLAGRGYARGACAIRDAVLMGLLAMRGPRIASVAAMTIGDHIWHEGGRWVVRLPSEHMKTHEPISWPLPDEMTDMIDTYVDAVRPRLAGAVATDAFWIGVGGAPMTTRGVTEAVRRRSRQWFGWSFGPHACRRFITTTVATEAPELLPETAAMLGHGTETQMKHYNDAKADAAARRYGSLIERLRQETEVLAARRYGWDRIGRHAPRGRRRAGR